MGHRRSQSSYYTSNSDFTQEPSAVDCPSLCSLIDLIVVTSFKGHGSEGGQLNKATLLAAVSEAVLKRRKLKVTEDKLS